MPLLQLLKPEVRYMGNDESTLALHALQDISVLVICNIKLSRETKGDKFPVPKFFIVDKLLIRNMCDLKNDVVNSVV